MAKLNRRERRAKRERNEALTRLKLQRQAEGLAERKLLGALPTQERNWLLGTRHDPLANLKETTHRDTVYVVMGIGQGKKRPKLRPARFLPDFMAPGHEALAVKIPSAERVEVRRIPLKKVRRKK